MAAMAIRPAMQSRQPAGPPLADPVRNTTPTALHGGDVREFALVETPQEPRTKNAV
jgi:hypothetical protein